MWNLEVKQGFDDMTFRFKKLEHATAVIEALYDSIVPDKEGNKIVFKLTYEEKENTDESL